MAARSHGEAATGLGVPRRAADWRVLSGREDHELEAVQRLVEGPVSDKEAAEFTVAAHLIENRTVTGPRIRRLDVRAMPDLDRMKEEIMKRIVLCAVVLVALAAAPASAWDVRERQLGFDTFRSRVPEPIRVEPYGRRPGESLLPQRQPDRMGDSLLAPPPVYVPKRVSPYGRSLLGND